MNKDREHKLRERAYHLWEEAGRPHGEDDRFWKLALAMEQGDVKPEAEAAVAAKPHAREPAAKAKPAAKAAPAAKAPKPDAEKPKAAAKPPAKAEARPPAKAEAKPKTAKKKG